MVAGRQYRPPVIVVVIGGGVAGLGSALAFAHAGHQVTIVERDSSSLPATPDEAFSSWSRRGAPQVRHSHAFLARLRNLLRDREPALLHDLLAAGATELRFTENLPVEMIDRDPRPGDEDLVALACRRTTFEWVLRRDAIASRGVAMIEGTVAGLLTGPEVAQGVPHVNGVRLSDGRQFGGDIVIDASGRRSPLPAWLADIGAAPVPEHEEDTGIVYSSRFYRLRPDADEPSQEGPIGGDLGYLKFAVFVGDNRTFSITFGIPTDDHDLRPLFREEPFSAAATALPACGRWIEPGLSDPITGVEVMARLLNRRRRFVVDGQPLATGIYAVGDANMCTNPLYGRGCSLGMVSAYLLADVIAEHPGDAIAASLAYDAAMRREVEPWYKAAVAQDRQARQELDPSLALPPDDDGDGDDDGAPAVPGLDPSALRSILRDGVFPATRTDPVVLRAFLRVFNLLDPPDSLLRDPDVIGRVLSVWQERDSRPPPAPLGPPREAMLDIVAAATSH